MSSNVILVTAAHPDDIEFGVAGSVAKWVREGNRVFYCIITDGSAGSNEPDTDRDALIATREAEQRAAAKIVGVEDVFFLGYKDGSLQPSIELRRDLTRLIRQLKPFRFVCQDPTTMFPRQDYINHPDHRAAGEASVYAYFPSAESRPIFPELLEEGLEPHKVDELYLYLTTEGDLFVEVTEYMALKIKALRCHKSQISEDDLPWIIGFSEEVGQRAGFSFAEVFRVMGRRNDAE